MMRSLKLQGRPWSFSDIPYSRARFEAGNPSLNGTAHDFEQINALHFRCDHERPRLICASVFRIPTVVNSSMWNAMYNSIPDGEQLFQEMLYQCSRLRASAHV